jgi:alginate O-acetyltransferase complex protein AlgI
VLFNSWEFLILLLFAFVLYYAPWSNCRHGKAWQVCVALLASVIFYGWQDPRLIALLAISCVGNSIATARIILHKVAGDDALVKRWTRRAVVLNLSLLAIFKYAPFVVGLLPFLPTSWLAAVKCIPLPIGISFYTFHGISMIVDVSRGEVTREGDALMSKGGRFAKGVRDIGFYLIFFPQLVAGPIVKAKEFWPQIGAKRFGDIPWRLVMRALIAGYFFKIFVADNLAEATGSLTLGPAHLAESGPLDLLPLLYCYSFQIFADFAGYSLIAIGLALMFGYRFPVNFNFPYLSTGIIEFWRRWHMSLSAWLRDYLYIPLGGNQKGPARTYLNLFLVMFLGGLWHGAEWKFALWGTFHGFFLALERFGSGLKFRKTKSSPGSRVGLFPIPFNFQHPTFQIAVALVKWLFTFHVVTALWLTFLMPDMASITAFFEGVFSGRTGFSGPPTFSLVFYGTAVVLYHGWGLFKEHGKDLVVKYLESSLEPVIQGLMIFLILSNPGAPRGFIYFQF